MYFAKFVKIAVTTTALLCVETYTATTTRTVSASEAVQAKVFMGAKNERVKSWLPTIRQVRKDLGLSESQYPDALVLALIDVESDGDPYANRPNSQFHGLLQMGQYAGRDVGFENKGRHTTESLMGDGRTAIEMFFRLQERYKRLHGYELQTIALLWKGGYGTTETYAKLLESEGQEAATQFLRDAGTHLEYLRRFNEFYGFWSSGEGEQVVPRAKEETSHKGLEAQITKPRAPSGAYVRGPEVSTAPGCAHSVIDDPGDTTTPVSSAPVSSTEDSRASVPGAAPKKVDTERYTASREGTSEVLEYISKNYSGDLDAFAQTAVVRSAAGHRGWTPGDTRIIQGFVEDVDADDGDGVGFSFQATLFDIATTYVKPLVDPVIDAPWGQKRSTNPDGEKIRDPRTGEIAHRHHLGVDYATLKSHGSLGRNQLCYAISSGTVRRAAAGGGYGWVVYVEHDGGVSSRYAHLQEMLVKAGDKVDVGQPVGRCGTSNTSSSNARPQHGATRPHLHFELRINLGVIRSGEIHGSILSNTMNVAIDPEPILSAAPNPGSTPVEVDPEMQRIRDARDSFGQIASNAASPSAASDAADSYDTCAALERSIACANLTRKDLYQAQYRNAFSQTRVARAIGLQPQNFEESS